jgi:predicted nuclease with TOPRIM domain
MYGRETWKLFLPEGQMTNLAGMTPEEKDRLLETLLREKNGGGAQASPMPENSGGDIQAFVAQICDVLEFLCQEIETVRKEVTDVRGLVVDDLFGGLKKMYDQNRRTKGIDDIRSKYGELFSPHEKVLKATDPDMDIYETIFDKLEELKGGEGFSEEGFDSSVKEWAKLVADKIDQLKAEGKIPEDAQVSVEVATDKTNAEAEPDSPARKFVDGIKKKNGNKVPLLF